MCVWRGEIDNVIQEREIEEVKERKKREIYLIYRKR